MNIYKEPRKVEGKHRFMAGTCVDCGKPLSPICIPYDSLPRSPKRIQRRRTKGWKMPDGAVYVGRPGKWGNPFRVNFATSRAQCCAYFRGALLNSKMAGSDMPTMRDVMELRGKDLACWCRLDQECHADVLLEIANEVNP